MSSHRVKGRQPTGPVVFTTSALLPGLSRYYIFFLVVVVSVVVTLLGGVSGLVGSPGFTSVVCVEVVDSEVVACAGAGAGAGVTTCVVGGGVC